MRAADNSIRFPSRSSAIEIRAVVQSGSVWLQQLSSMDHEDDDPGTTWNVNAREREADRMSPRQAWRAIQAGLPSDVIISTDIGNNCAIGNAYPPRTRILPP
jgi:sulfoacetaldehyde acetyltransferase